MDETKTLYFPRVDSYVMPALWPIETLRYLRLQGGFRVESLVFFAGAATGNCATVSHIFIPKGPGVFRHRLQHRVSEDVIAALGDLLDPPRLVLLGQVHTHARQAFHSQADDAFSLDTPGFLSLVIPNFGRGTPEQWRAWAFFECTGQGQFRELAATEVEQRFVIAPHAPLEVQEIHV